MAGNDLRLKIEVIDHGSIIDGFQKVANRIALGLVLAALIVGAAMLMRVPTPFTILGYPGLAMLLFLAAAGGGFWMAWTILAGDVKNADKDQVDQMHPTPNWKFYVPCFVARSAGGIAMSSGCAASCALTIASARATASASPAR